jgi:hypothetical protein
MRMIFMGVVALSVCSGCTATLLNRYTLNQSMSIAEMRYRQALYALAVVANNNGSLPSFALTTSGTANLTNTVSVDTATLWDAAVYGFSKETLMAFGQHNPELQWTLDPVVTAPQLEALLFACLWVVSQEQGMQLPTEGSYPWELLRERTIKDVNGCSTASCSRFHFGVLEQLQCIPRGWLNVSRHGSVPKHIAYQATYGDTTVWVTPDRLDGLSDFTLAMLDIGTTDPASLLTAKPKASVELVLKPGTAPPSTAIGFGAGDKITEKWPACQDVCGGPILLTRADHFKKWIAPVPKIIRTQPKRVGFFDSVAGAHELMLDREIPMSPSSEVRAIAPQSPRDSY